MELSGYSVTFSLWSVTEATTIPVDTLQSRPRGERDDCSVTQIWELKVDEDYEEKVIVGEVMSRGLNNIVGPTGFILVML